MQRLCKSLKISEVWDWQFVESVSFRASCDSVGSRVQGLRFGEWQFGGMGAWGYDGGLSIGFD